MKSHIRCRSVGMAQRSPENPTDNPAIDGRQVFQGWAPGLHEEEPVPTRLKDGSAMALIVEPADGLEHGGWSDKQP
jgi:hypothetical protein